MRGVHLVVAALLACAAAAQSYEYFLNSYTATLPHGCQVATLADFQSAEFAAQYNKNGYLSVKSPIPSTVDCGVDVLSAPGGTPGRLAPNEGAGFVVTFKPKTGPYEGCGTINYTDTIALGTSLDDGNLLWTTITPEIQNQTILGSFYSPGSVALLKCEAAPASQFYLSAYVSIPEGCTVATWADFTSDAFMAQYNAGGYLPVKGGAIPASTDCGIDVLATAGGQPGRIGFTNGSDFLLTYPPHSGPYEGCGGAAYTDKIALGTEATNVAYATLTKDIVSTMGVESFLTPGSVAIINCGGAAPTPAPTPAPAAAEFYLSAYVSIPEGCEVATFDDFKSDAFVAQYNSVGYLSVKGGAIPEATDCGIDVLPTAGGAPGRLQLNNGSYDYVLTYPPHSGPYEGCGTAPYTDKIAFGTQLANVAWPKLTPAILSVLAVESFYSPGSVALIKCGASPPPGPTTPSPVGTGSFALANYNATYVPPHCSVVTLEQAQSQLFADYYNIHGYLDVIGTIVPNTDCGIDVLTAAGGTPGRILTSGDFVSTYNPDGSWECNGAPFTTRISLGPNLGADPLGRWKTINQTIQTTFTVGSFYPPGSVALLYCEEGAQSRWSARGAH